LGGIESDHHYSGLFLLPLEEFFISICVYEYADLFVWRARFLFQNGRRMTVLGGFFLFSPFSFAFSFDRFFDREYFMRNINHILRKNQGERVGKPRCFPLPLFGGGVFLLTAFWLFSLTGFAPAQAAGEYPERSIHLVVPWSAGGPSDTYARAIAHDLGGILGQPVVVENKPGATGAIGVTHVARAKADGYTLLFGNTVSMIGSVVSSPEAPRFDPIADFAPIALVAETSYILSAHASAGIRTYQEFLARALDKKQPPIAVGSTGNGATSDMFYDWLLHTKKANLTKVAFKGTSALVSDLIAGHLPVGSAGLSLVASHYQSGKVYPLAVVGSKRLPELPDVPSVVELGLASPNLDVWDGVFAPAGTPPEIRAILARALQKAVGNPAYQELVRKNGSGAIFIVEDAATARLKKDLAERRQFKASLPENQP
jgi:tripartite-type tricarboxylate transporter receptor subunit TctC